jgi:hypothetical protein
MDSKAERPDEAKLFVRSRSKIGFPLAPIVLPNENGTGQPGPIALALVSGHGRARSPVPSGPDRVETVQKRLGGGVVMEGLEAAEKSLEAEMRRTAVDGDGQACAPLAVLASCDGVQEWSHFECVIEAERPPTVRFEEAVPVVTESRGLQFSSLPLRAVH